MSWLIGLHCRASLASGLLLCRRALLCSLPSHEPNVRASPSLPRHHGRLVGDVLAGGLVQHGLGGVWPCAICHALELAEGIPLLTIDILERADPALLDTDAIRSAQLLIERPLLTSGLRHRASTIDAG